MMQCKEQMAALCSACSRVLCATCMIRHKGKEECRVFTMYELYEAWCALPKRLQVNDFNIVFNAITVAPKGTPVNSPQKVPKSEVTQYIAKIFHVLDVFEFGTSYLRAAYLAPLRRKVAPSQPPVGFLSDDRQAAATSLLRLWAIAGNNQQRGAIMKKAVSLLTGIVSIEDTVTALQKSNPKARVPSFANDNSGRDWLRFEKLYQDHVDQCEMLSRAWQDFDPSSVSLKMQGRDNAGMIGQVDLVLADPWYLERYQPKMSEHNILRKLFDTISHDYTVFLIFGKMEFLAKCWLPVFQKGVGGSKISYKVDSSQFCVVR